MIHATTPIDHLDIPSGAAFTVMHRAFGPHSFWQTIPYATRDAARAHLIWLMRMANIAEIRIAIFGAGITAVVSIARPHNLALWECPQMPEWRSDSDDTVAHEVVAEAMAIIGQHQRRAT